MPQWRPRVPAATGGFAVVDGEVRMLAQRSAEASQQIRVLVDASLQQVEAGARLVDTSGEVMHDISGRVQQVVTAMARIDAGSERQVSAVDDVERLLRRIGEGTRQSGNVARASSQAAAEMRVQAQELAAAAERFVVVGEAEAAKTVAGNGGLRRSA